MKSKPDLSTPRAVEIFEEMISIRRLYCGDNDFFRMTEFWGYLCEGSEEWSTRTYKSNQTDDFKRKAGVIEFAGLVTLTADEKLLENAERGCLLSNFILAHEIGHLALGHHVGSRVTKNFQLFAGPSGMSKLPARARGVGSQLCGGLSTVWCCVVGH